jgi:hypothetical protein
MYLAHRSPQRSRCKISWAHLCGCDNYALLVRTGSSRWADHESARNHARTKSPAAMQARTVHARSRRHKQRQSTSRRPDAGRGKAARRKAASRGRAAGRIRITACDARLSPSPATHARMQTETSRATGDASFCPFHARLSATTRRYVPIRTSDHTYPRRPACWFRSVSPRHGAHPICLPGRRRFHLWVWEGMGTWVRRRPGPDPCAYVLACVGAGRRTSWLALAERGGAPAVLFPVVPSRRRPRPTTARNHERPRPGHGKDGFSGLLPATDRSYRLRSIGPVKRRTDWVLDAHEQLADDAAVYRP